MDGADQDRHLIRRLGAGDAAALEAIYDRHAGVVFAVIVRVVTDRRIAEELLQEAFLRTWQHAASYDGSLGGVRPWLLGIAHNLALNELRRQRRRPREWRDRTEEGAIQALAAVPDPSPGPADAAWAAARHAHLRRVLGHLPEAQREVVALYAAGYSQSEIASRLDLPLGTVKTWMRRALIRLREILQAEGFDLD